MDGMTHRTRFVIFSAIVAASVIVLGSCALYVSDPASSSTFEARASTSERSPVLHTPGAKGNSGSNAAETESAAETSTSPALAELPGVYTGDLETSPLLQPGVPTRRISLQDVIRLSLEHNLDIKITEYDRKISRDEIEVQKGIFDTLFTSGISQTEIEQQHVLEKGATIPGLPQSEWEAFGIAAVQQSGVKSFEAGLSQLLPTGGVLELLYTDGRFEQTPSAFATASPYYAAQLTLTFIHPLLKYFGSAVTNAGIRVAKNNASISQEQFRFQVMNQLSQALKAYWELVFAIYNYDVQQISLEQAQDLLRINTVKFEAGVVPSTDVLQAKAQVAAREEQIIMARQQIHNTQDLLKQLMNVPKTDATWHINIIPQDRPMYYEVRLDEEQFLQQALSYRPEYRQAQTTLDNRKIERMVARNKRLPELNLYGYYGFSGADESNSPAVENMETLDYEQWQVGLEFRYPLPNRVGRYFYHQSQLQYDKARESLDNLKNLITLEIRNTLRDVETNRKRIGVTSTSVEYEEAKLDAEKKRFDVGMATSHDVLEFQRDLASSRASHLRAIIDYNKALIDLERAKGTLLDSYQIQIDNQ
jgi:outer membrane protein